jgi:hypothetical protein
MQRNRGTGVVRAAGSVSRLPLAPPRRSGPVGIAAIGNHQDVYLAPGGIQVEKDPPGADTQPISRLSNERSYVAPSGERIYAERRM